jgi:hypothetical protein
MIPPVRSPLSRHRASPALRFLRATLLAPDRAEAAKPFAVRLAAGGIVREIAAEDDLRRTLPIVGAMVKEAGLLDRLPADERSILSAARLSANVRAEAVRQTLEPLGAVCAQTGVVPLLLKGTALHGKKGVPAALRPVSDVDVLVKPADFQALRVGLTFAELAPEPLTAGRLAAYDGSDGKEFFLSDFVFRRTDGEGVPVEAKLDPVQVGRPLKRAEAFFEGATDSAAYAGFQVPAPEPMAVQQAVHLARHDGSDVLWFAELAGGVRAAGSRFDVAKADALVAEEGLLGTVRAAFAAAEELFPGSFPKAALRGGGLAGWTPARLRGRVGKAGPPNERAATWGLSLAHALSSRRPLSTLATLGRRLWPRPEYVAARMGLPEGRKPSIVHRVRRLLLLAGSRGGGE